MSSISQAVFVSPQDIFVQSTSQQAEIGSEAVTRDGRRLRYCKAGELLVIGKLQQAPAQLTNHQDVVPAAAAIGATSVTVTLGNTAATANQYAGGFLVITVTPGQGYAYQISSHPAADASATLALALVDPIVIALTTGSNCDLVPNPYLNVIVNPTTATGLVAGGSVNALASGSFGWLTTGGLCNLLVDDQTVVVGTNVAASNQAAGAIEPHTGVQAIVGQALTGGATTEYCAIQMNLH